MTYDPVRHHRRSIRLRGYDYAQGGAYFVTLVARQRACLFGDIVHGQIKASSFGDVVLEEWLRSSRVRREIVLDAFVLMPNHFHAIVIVGAVGAHGRAPLRLHRAPRSLGSFVAGFKSTVTSQ